MKILLAADVSIHKVIGGAERVLYEQAVRLKQMGHEVHVITRMDDEHADAHELIEGVEEWRYNVDQSNPVTYFNSSKKNCQALFEVLQKKISFDIVNFHQPFTALGILNSPSSAGMPCVYTCHSLAFEEYISRNPKSESTLGSIKYQINVLARKLIEKKGLNGSQRIIVLSDFTRDKLKKSHNIGAAKVEIIPGGGDLEKFTPAGRDEKALIRRSLGLPEDKTIFFTVRNLVARMGIDNLVTAFGESRDGLENAFLVIGGKGVLLEELQRLVEKYNIADRVLFTGFIAEEELPDYYRCSDIFVLPTKELEGFGLVTVEALASGLPVLGTPIGGTLEIIGKFDPRMLFADTSAFAIAEKLVEYYFLIEEGNFLEDKSAAARRFAETNYSWDRNAELTEKLFLSVI